MPTDIPSGIGRKLADLFRDQADIAVRDLAEAVLQRAKADAPLLDGTLADSGHVRKVRPGVYEIVFDAPYAAKQHEALQYSHPHGGGSKYLEKNVLLAARELEGALASGVRALTTRSGGGSRIDTRSF